MKKALIIASVASMIQQFNMGNICILRELGYEVDVAANFKTGNTCSDDQIDRLKQELKKLKVGWYQIDFDRNVMNIRADWIAYRQAMKLIRKKKYDLLHCHSPIGGVIGRLAGFRCSIYTIYTAHGFHFYEGAPVKNWLLYYPIEKFLSRYTDRLIVINQEDYRLAQKKFHMKKLSYIPGIGVDINRKLLDDAGKAMLRARLGIPQEAFLIVNVAEFTPNKNQVTVLRAVRQMRNDNIFFLMCGIGEKKRQLEQYVSEQNLGRQVKFAGYCSNIRDILQISDCFVLSSLREGLSVALMEAMAEGRPVVCTGIRGNKDLVENGAGGYLVEPLAVDEYKHAFEKMEKFKRENPEKLQKMGEINRQTIKKFDSETVHRMMKEVYGDI